MPCQHGSQKKPSAPESGFVYPADYICADAGEASAICKLTRFSPGGRFPIEYILSVQNFCAAGEPPIPSGYDPSDVIGSDGKTDTTGLFEKNRQLALRAKYSEWCECAPAPPPYTGGQCQIFYNVSAAYDLYYSSGIPPSIGDRAERNVMGPITRVSEDAQGDLSCDYGIPTRVEKIKSQAAGITDVRNVRDVRVVPFYANQPDNCGNIGSPTTPVDPPPPRPPVPPTFPFNIPIPPIIPPPVPGPAGPAGATGARGATGPCPGLSGTVEISAGGTPSMDINLVGDCEYNMNIVVPGITTETKTLLFGIEYVVTFYPPKASYNIQQNGLYFIPRSGALRFRKTGTDKVSENFEIHGEKGFVVNPRPGFYNSWDLTPFTGFEISVTKMERVTEVVENIVFDNDG